MHRGEWQDSQVSVTLFPSYAQCPSFPCLRSYLVPLALSCRLPVRNKGCCQQFFALLLFPYLRVVAMCQWVEELGLLSHISLVQVSRGSVGGATMWHACISRVVGARILASICQVCAPRNPIGVLSHNKDLRPSLNKLVFRF